MYLYNINFYRYLIESRTYLYYNISVNYNLLIVLVIYLLLPQLYCVQLKHNIMIMNNTECVGLIQ